MTETGCSYQNRDETLVAYMYGEIEPEPRGRFEAHLATCSRCHEDLAAFRGVRTRLAQWTPPALAAQHPASNPEVPLTTSWWRSPPVWAQTAAALLLLGVAAGVANFDARLDRDGLSLRTGWSRPASPPAALLTRSTTSTTSNTAPTAAPSAPSAPSSSSSPSLATAAPWRAELTALETGLRAEIASRARRTSASVSDADLVRRVRALVDESERRQQRELALRVADAMRDIETQRRADLVKIDRSLGAIQNNTGVEVLKQRELLNYLVRVSQSR